MRLVHASTPQIPVSRAEEITMNAEVNAERKNTERIFARAFTLLGGVFWIVSAFAFAGPLMKGGIVYPLVPLVFTAGVLTLGWFYERLTALILGLAALGTVAWGVIMGWDPVVWGVMLSLFVTPTVVAAVLFYLAGNTPAPDDTKTVADTSS